MTYLFDTDHLSIAQRGRGPDHAVLALRASAYDPSEVAACVASFHEQSLGCHTYISGARTPAEVLRGYAILMDVVGSFASVTTLPFDAAAQSIFDGLAARTPQVAPFDLRVASIALAHDLTLLTRYADDFAGIPGLRTEDWTK